MQSVTPQNRHVASLTHEFLSVHWDQKKPLLLGYSGGPDSKALLYALLECGVKPHLAHVDHGWRETSGDEAKQLEEEAARLGCPFYTTRLSGEKSEDAARKGRFAFFEALAKDFSAVLLAHQMEDLAETVLKRLFEGAHPAFLGGMQPVSHRGEMTIWRPLLKVRKKEIWQFLEERSLGYIQDASNLDPSYLRARMRLEMFPYLTKMFGKEIVPNLALFAERANEWKEFLDGQLPTKNSPRVVQRHFLQKKAKEEGQFLSRERLEERLDAFLLDASHLV